MKLALIGIGIILFTIGIAIYSYQNYAFSYIDFIECLVKVVLGLFFAPYIFLFIGFLLTFNFCFIIIVFPIMIGFLSSPSNAVSSGLVSFFYGLFLFITDNLRRDKMN